MTEETMGEARKVFLVDTLQKLLGQDSPTDFTKQTCFRNRSVEFFIRRQEEKPVRFLRFCTSYGCRKRRFFSMNSHRWATQSRLRSGSAGGLKAKSSSLSMVVVATWSRVSLAA